MKKLIGLILAAMLPVSYVFAQQVFRGNDHAEICRVDAAGLLDCEADAAKITTGELPDARLSATVTQLGASITLGTETDGNYAGSSSEGGAATTSLALDANPAACPAGDFAKDTDADGTLTCDTPSYIANTDAESKCTVENFLEGDGSCTDVIKESELASLANLNTQLGSSIADGAHTAVDDTPDNGDVTSAPTANWAFDHDADADAHHAESHTVASHSDTTATGAELETLTDGSNADALHAHAGIVTPYKGLDTTVNICADTSMAKGDFMISSDNGLIYSSTGTLQAYMNWNGLNACD